uniref:Serpin domain-containing protein n=1 Tax=Hucho hucho TaxID=62062 RepID=A0A4W5MB51_9TELE
MRAISCCAIATVLLFLAQAGPHNADFAFALYRSLSKANTENKNVFFSPLVIATSLAILSLGAKGDTHSHLYSALGYGAFTPEQVNEAMQLDMGSAVAMRDGFKPLAKFLEDAKHLYASEGFTIDFKNPTQDKITDLVKYLDPDTAMVLINYVFFRCRRTLKWDKPFDAKQTHKVNADMKRTGLYELYPHNFTTVVMLPYKGNSSMMVVLPDKSKMAYVEAFINKKYLKNLTIKDCNEYQIASYIEISLGDHLKEIGVVSAFGDKADFSANSEETKLKVTHKTVLSLDEKGTEVTAVTTIEIMPMSLSDTIILNRPFLLFILEDYQEHCLHGKMTNPTAK